MAPTPLSAWVLYDNNIGHPKCYHVFSKQTADGSMNIASVEASFLLLEELGL